jgi:hypothetical protein
MGMGSHKMEVKDFRFCAQVGAKNLEIKLESKVWPLNLVLMTSGAKQ